MRHVRHLHHCLGLLLFTAAAFAQDAKPKKLGIDELRAWVAKLSTTDPDPIPKLMNLCIQGRESWARASRMDAEDRPLLGWLALNELALHEVSDKRWMEVLRKVGLTVPNANRRHTLNASGSSVFIDLFDALEGGGVEPPRPDLLDKIWTKENGSTRPSTCSIAPIRSSRPKPCGIFGSPTVSASFAPRLPRAGPGLPSGDSAKACCAPSVRPCRSCDAGPCSSRGHSHCKSASCPQSEKPWITQARDPLR